MAFHGNVDCSAILRKIDTAFIAAAKPAIYMLCRFDLNLIRRATMDVNGAGRIVNDQLRLLVDAKDLWRHGNLFDGQLADRDKHYRDAQQKEDRTQDDVDQPPQDGG